MNEICKYNEVLFIWSFYLVWQNRFIAMNSLISWLGFKQKWDYPDVHNNQLNKWILWNFQKPKRLEVIETIFCCCEQKQTAMFLRWPQGREWQEAFRGWMSQSYRCTGMLLVYLLSWLLSTHFRTMCAGRHRPLYYQLARRLGKGCLNTERG